MTIKTTKIALALCVATTLFACNNSSNTKVDLSAQQIEVEINNHPCNEVHKSQCTSEAYKNLTSLKKTVATLALEDK